VAGTLSYESDNYAPENQCPLLKERIKTRDVDPSMPNVPILVCLAKLFVAVYTLDPTTNIRCVGRDKESAPVPAGSPKGLA
jgi:hypothetical protein